MIPLRGLTTTTTTTTTSPGAATLAAAPAAAVAARVVALVAGLALVLGWLAPAAHGADGAHPEATDSASLNKVVEEREADVAEAQDALSVAARAASDALERYTLAVRRLDAAHTAEAAAQADLAAAQDRLAAARASLGRWARSAYAGGGSLSPGAGLATVLQSRTTDDLGSAVVTLRRVGESRSRAIDMVEAAEREQVRASTAAAAAAHAAETAAVEASTFRTQADAALRQQREVLSVSETQLAQAQDAAASAAQREQAIAAANALAAADGNRVTGPVGDCRGGDVEHYPNGMIPLSALCRLAAQPDHYLRADAALAFDTMSRAFAARFGTPICVTDSYRTYAEQVRLKAAKPGLAATPGMSNHGWGTATDLCGGIQSFGTAEHQWLAANAPLYNWFLPSWARQGGGKPEPWHFEFAG